MLTALRWSSADCLDSTIQFGDIIQDFGARFHFQCISTAMENPGSSNGEDNWTATHTFEGKASDGNRHHTVHVRMSYRERDTGKPAELEFDLKEGETAWKGFELGSAL